MRSFEYGNLNTRLNAFITCKLIINLISIRTFEFKNKWTDLWMNEWVDGKTEGGHVAG
jgi:hypothetical protein